MKTPIPSSATYGLIGHPLGHSFSKAFFTRLFAETGSHESYENFDIPALTPQAMYELVMLAPNLRGFNVTSPYKIAIMDYLDTVSDITRTVGAVNTVRIRRADDGRVIGLDGHNTDVEGFREAVRQMVERLDSRGALVLGTGGASNAAVEALRQLGVDTLRVSRTPHGDRQIAYGDIDADMLASHPLIVNATPLGTFPDVHSAPPLPYHLLGPANKCFDMVYNPEVTTFMARAAERGAEVANGLEMLYGQAIASLKFFRNKS